MIKSFGDNDIKLNKIFLIERGGRKARYKIIRHPEWPEVFALVADHPYLHYNTPQRDEKYIINASRTLEGAYEHAVMHT